MLALTVLAAPEHKDGMDLKLKVSHDKLKKPIQSEKTQSAETERSHYFTKNDLQHRLGEEFFNQSCIRLAKAFLGKVITLCLHLLSLCRGCAVTKFVSV